MRRQRAYFAAVGLLVCLWAVAGTYLPHADGTAQAEAVSSPAILQIFEARWDTVEDRMADVHQVGYGSMWVPPVARAGSVFSAGYDVFDRFDLGKPRDESHYGTHASFKTMVEQANRASVDVYPDLIINHNGFGNRLDTNFVALGGYPGFALTLPGVDIDGDFHDPSLSWEQNSVNGQLFGLIDIAQEKDHRFIRHPIMAGDSRNIPAGSIWNRPDPNNTRFYTDRDLGGTTVFDPELDQTVTLYDFNSGQPSAGDPTTENATGLLMRNVRWMTQEFGVKGFRVDAAKHAPEFTLDFLDQAVFRAIRQLQHDGSYQPTYLFSEIASGNKGFIQSFIRRDLPDLAAIAPTNTTVGGNRDALDFPLFYALRDNLTAGGGNNWHRIRSANMDIHDDGFSNGSQGVAFVQSHDDTGPSLENVAYAYTLMRPGNALVYLNAEQYGPTSFPRPGKVDALGGYFGETVTRLVELRNSHGRGDFHERWIDDAFNPNGFSHVYIYERSEAAVVGLSNRNDSFVETRSAVQTNFAPGTVLVELTGNAADETVDPDGAIPEAVRVNELGQVPISIPGNQGHGRGYVVYGVAAPEGTMTLGNTAGTLAGATPAPGNFGTARLVDVDVVTEDSFTVRLETTPVTLPAPAGESNPVRDVHADGDKALVKIDGGLDLNGNGEVDDPIPGSVGYGFEQFTEVNTPGYFFESGANRGTGFGVYQQTIDTTRLAEGRHYVTVRAFRHRDAGSEGDGGPAVFTDFRRTVYVDRLAPESAVVSFEPFASDSGNPNNRDLVIQSLDQTAESIHVFFNEPAATGAAEMIQRATQGQGSAGYYDRDLWIYGEFGVMSGNYVVTVVTFEPTGNVNVQRFPGIFTQTQIGVGLGDLNADGFVRSNDLVGVDGFEQILYSQNTEFNPAADADGDGLVDNRDLFAIGDLLVATGADSRVMGNYQALLLRRGDVNQSGTTDAADIDFLNANLGQNDWLFDLNADGITDALDVATLVERIFGTFFGDANLDGTVDVSDFNLWNANRFSLGSGWAAGDFNGDGLTDASDFNIWNGNKFRVGSPGSPAVVPEPGSYLLWAWAWITIVGAGRRSGPRHRGGNELLEQGVRGAEHNTRPRRGFPRRAILCHTRGDLGGGEVN